VIIKITFIEIYLLIGREDKASGIDEGQWDAIHLVTTTIDSQNKVKYRLNTTIFLFVKSTSTAHGALDCGG